MRFGGVVDDNFSIMSGGVRYAACVRVECVLLDNYVILHRISLKGT